MHFFKEVNTPGPQINTATVSTIDDETEALLSQIIDDETEDIVLFVFDRLLIHDLHTHFSMVCFTVSQGMHWL